MINKDILDFIEENDVKFIRLGFCDPLGNQKNISIMASELEQAFSDGISFDASAIEGFANVEKSDLLLFPDPDTLSFLTWRPYTNSVLRFFCDIKHPDGTPFAGDGRHMLKTAVNHLKELGFNCKIGSECEFYLFKTDDNDEPTLKTLDNGGYLDISPLDKGENIRREICLSLEEMGLYPESSHHEQGPGQNEIDFKFSDPLRAADNILTFKSVVKSVASRNGLFASFMPKPFPFKSGNGMHINISLHKDGVNLFSDHRSDNFKYAKNFIAGILEKIEEITLFLNPVNNSYERFGAFEAPKYISWSHQNRSQLIRIPAQKNGRERMELRSADPTLNPYIGFSLILYAGIYGIENNLELPAAVDEDLYNADSVITNALKSLPKNLGEAIKLAKQSDFVKKHLDCEFFNRLSDIKSCEFSEFEKAENKETYYKEKYFEIL